MYNTVTLSGTNDFLGFLVIAHIPGMNSNLLGAFNPLNTNQQNLQCDPNGVLGQATVAHTRANNDRNPFSSMTFMWQAPSGSDGTVDFRFLIIIFLCTTTLKFHPWDLAATLASQTGKGG